MDKHSKFIEKVKKQKTPSVSSRKKTIMKVSSIYVNPYDYDSGCISDTTKILFDKYKRRIKRKTIQLDANSITSASISNSNAGGNSVSSNRFKSPSNLIDFYSI